MICKEDKGIEEVLVFGGGVIPDKDVETLLEMGVQSIFILGSSIM